MKMPEVEAQRTREDIVVLYTSSSPWSSSPRSSSATPSTSPSSSSNPYSTLAPLSLSSPASLLPTLPSPSITFPPSPPYPLPNAKHHESLHFELIHLSNPHLQSYLSSILALPVALVLDVFCISVLDVAARLAIPTYFFYTSGTNCLVAFLHLPAIDVSTTKNFKDGREETSGEDKGSK